MNSPFTGKPCEICHEYSVADIVDLYRTKLDMDVSTLFAGHQSVRLLSCPDSGLLFFDPCITGDSAFYERLQQLDFYYMPWRPEFETAAAYLRGAKVLEIGSGVGNFSAYLEKNDNGNGFSYTGLELNREAAVTAQGRGINVVCQDLEGFLKDGNPQFDAVCVFQVLEHVRDIAGFLDSCLKACKPGGYLLVSLPAEDGFMKQAVNQVLNYPPHHVSWWPDSVFSFVASHYGLELAELKHEPMEDIHKLWFLKVVFRAFFARMLGVQARGNIDLSFRGALLDKIVVPLAWVARKMIVDDAFYPAGHTVTAVFRKPMAADAQP